MESRFAKPTATGKMKLTRRQLKKLIQEAIRRVPFPPVTADELENIRSQSRTAAEIDPMFRQKIEDIELSSDPGNITMARELAKSLGSDRGEITSQQEKDFLRAQMIHTLIPVLTPIFGDELYSFETRFIELLHKFYQTSQKPGEFRVWRYDLGANVFSGLGDNVTEDHDTILEKLSGPKPEYIISSIGPVTGGLDYEELDEMYEYFWKKYHPNQTPGHYIFRIAKQVRPDLVVYNGN